MHIFIQMNLTNPSEECWTGQKPNVAHFRIFGCIAYVHVPNQRRVKLEEKSQKCVFLGVSEESKAYTLFDPESKQIITSRDVIFAEEEIWNWGRIDGDTDELKWEDAEPFADEEGNAGNDHAGNAQMEMSKFKLRLRKQAVKQVEQTPPGEQTPPHHLKQFEGSSQRELVELQHTYKTT
jgi:hypothetical protein